MIDLKLLENEFDEVSKRLAIKGVDSDYLEELKTALLEKKRVLKEFEELQAKQNRLSKEFGELKRNGGDIAVLQGELTENKGFLVAVSEDLKEAEAKLDLMSLNIPNLPDSDVPLGKDESENVEIKRVLEPRRFDFEPKAHFELDNGWLDFEAGIKLAGSRFTVMRSMAAKLERALINYMLDFNTARGFEEVWVPVLTSRTSLTATGQLPKFEADLYLSQVGELPKDDLFLIPTSEVQLVNLYRDTIINKDQLPIKLTSHTNCFRKEAGSAGRDTRGMIRQHQFDKVELVALTHPDRSDEMFEEMVACASDLLTSLELPHRHLMLCSGDLGFGAAKTIDLEVWIPSENRYREISSISNTRDFQPRRAKIRFKDEKKNLFVHSLNGSSLAVGRTLIAIMENNQQADGTIKIPEVLKPYLQRG